MRNQSHSGAEPGRRVAVIGSGISGLAASWHLARSGCAVTLIEADDRPGGHSNTVTAALDADLFDVDTGFIVYNERTYPNLTRLFRTLEVETVKSNMSFAVSREGLEYSGTGLGGLLAQPLNVFRPRFWALLRDLRRFYAAAPNLMPAPGTTLSEMLELGGYSATFANDHLLPMMAAIWSTDADEVGEMQARAFLDFFINHGLLQIRDRPQWRTVKGGSRRYVDAILAHSGITLELNKPVLRVQRHAAGVRVSTVEGAREFDEVVLATHADRSLALLADPSVAEAKTLRSFRYTPSTAWLHTDTRLMPRSRRAWASWNYLGTPTGRLCVTYWMNRLQPLATGRDVLLTLNPDDQPDGVLGRFDYEHPVMNTETARARESLWALQGERRTWFCGAYFGYGFHEDGLQSGLAVAEQITGVARPWDLAEPNTRVHVEPLRHPVAPLSLSRPPPRTSQSGVAAAARLDAA